MKRRYPVKGSCPFVLEPGVNNQTVEPGGGYVDAELSPEREAWLIKVGCLGDPLPETPKTAPFKRAEKEDS